MGNNQVVSSYLPDPILLISSAVRSSSGMISPLQGKGCPIQQASLVIYRDGSFNIPSLAATSIIHSLPLKDAE